MRFIGVDIEREQKRGALELHTTNEVYFRDMRFDPNALMELLESSIEDAARNGFSAFRTAGELSWAVEGRNECDKLVTYEQMVQASYPGKPAVGICMYPIQSFEPAVLDRVVAAHAKVLDNGCHSSSTASLHVHWPEREAEIVTKKFTDHAPYHYVVQRQSGEVLAWGESADFNGALRAAHNAAGAVSIRATPSFSVNFHRWPSRLRSKVRIPSQTRRNSGAIREARTVITELNVAEHADPRKRGSCANRARTERLRQAHLCAFAGAETGETRTPLRGVWTAQRREASGVAVVMPKRWWLRL